MKKAAGHTLKIVGWIWLCVAVVAIIVGHAMIGWKDGLGAMFDILSPHNFINWIAILLTLAPGFVMHVQGEKILARVSAKSASKAQNL